MQKYLKPWLETEQDCFYLQRRAHNEVEDLLEIVLMVPVQRNHSGT